MAKTGPQRQWKYRSRYATEKWLEEFLAKARSENRLPSITLMAIYIGVVEMTITHWRKEHPEFDRICRKVLEAQKQQLVDLGLANKYNSTITKLMLSHNHQVRETTETIHSGNEKTPLRIIFEGDAND